ncbi:S8 family serine peptidase [Pantanalinema rosaneae CENA516]|uniref:S8 family serine peptidase n=1 Tax=Pantanalinema rosaneae TaxID=1620701 RepID=UPI003D6F1C45
MTKQRPVAKGFQQKASTDTQTSFLLEPILTPSAGIDGTEGTPEMAIAQLSPPALADFDFDLPGIDAQLDVSDSFLDHEGYDLSDGELEPVTFIDSLGSVDPIAPIGFESGVFTVGSSGEVGIDFLFDGGAYQGELAIFSLEGMEQFEPGSDAFIQEAARRALSSSDLGYVVISDTTDAARFSGSFAWEGDFNSGDYQGVQTFQMRPGDRLGFMLVPNGSVQTVLEEPCHGLRPLFSMSTANPNDGFQAGQIADVTGDGNTFVFEDLRVDGHSDLDYNDMVFQVRGATANAAHLDDVVDPYRDWRTSNLGQALVAYAEAYVNPNFSNIPTVDAPLSHQPFIGVIDTGFAANNPDIDYSRLILGYDWVGNDNNPLLQPGEGSEHGTHVLGIIGATQNNNFGIDGINDDAPIWVGRAIGSGQWANSLTEFVDAARESGQPNAVVNLSLDLTQINPDGSITTRYELTPTEWAALEYARQNNVLVVVAAGNDGGVMSALGQASQMFDNLITVGAADGYNRAEYSSYGYGLDIMAFGGSAEGGIFSTVADGIGTMAGTSVATAQVTGAISQVWAANPGLSYRQVIDLIKSTAQDLGAAGFDLETGAGLLNVAAAISFAKITQPEAYLTPDIPIPETWSGAGRVTPTERAAADEFMGRYYEWDAYTVRPGDTLSAIALQRMGNGTAPYYNFIASKNGIANPNLIYVNQVILIPRQVSGPSLPPPPPPPPPVTNRTPYVIKPGDTLWAIAQSRLGNGTKWTTISKDAAGTQFFTSEEARRLQVGQTVYLPVNWEPGTGTPIISRPIDTEPKISAWQHPLPGYPVTSEYGPRWGTFHHGIDIGTSGTTPPVKSAASGKVIYAGWDPTPGVIRGASGPSGGYGNLVIIEHPNGVRTYYAHLSSITVATGQTVTSSTVIGNVGSTGYSTGHHLHFEMRVSPYRWPNDTRNPRNYIRF